MTIRSTEIEVCTGCLLVLANGEHGDCDGTCRSCTATTPPGTRAVAIGDDLGFGLWPCALCDQPLAGDRRTAALLTHTN